MPVETLAQRMVRSYLRYGGDKLMNSKNGAGKSRCQKCVRTF